MNDFKAALDKTRFVALYASLELNNYVTVNECRMVNFDKDYRALPEGETREQLWTGYVRISEPVEVKFVGVSNDAVIQGAVAALDAEERKTIDELNSKLASIRERKQQLLAINFQPDEPQCTCLHPFDKAPGRHHSLQCPLHVEGVSA